MAIWADEEEEEASIVCPCFLEGDIEDGDKAIGVEEQADSIKA